MRRAVAQNVRVVPVRERGLVGMAYYPPGAGPHPAMIVLPGSQGGIPGPGAHAGGLASRGYVVLALAYFNAQGLPPLLQNIPLEYFATAVDWLKSQPSVEPARIGVLGTSRGGELALLLGATYPSAFRVVVANVPSNVVWPGLSDDSDVAGVDTERKAGLGHASRFTSADLALSGRERFLKRLQDTAAVARAEIPVERIDAPVLMFSAKDDQLWPSDIFAARAVERLRANHFKHPVEHYSYEQAGHQTDPAIHADVGRAAGAHPPDFQASDHVWRYARRSGPSERRFVAETPGVSRQVPTKSCLTSLPLLEDENQSNCGRCAAERGRASIAGWTWP